MTARPRLPLLVLAFLAAPALAQQSPNDFQLPPAPTPSATPNVQGPVDTDSAVPVRPRAIPTASPTARATPTRQPDIVLPDFEPAPRTTANPARTPVPARNQPSNRNAPAAPPQGLPSSAETAGDLPPPPAAQVPDESLARTPIPSLAPGEPVAELASGPDEPGDWLWWIAALAGLGAAALAAGAVLRRRRAAAPAPVIERPQVASGASGATAAAAAVPEQGALSLRVEALRMSRSFLNATLSYRVTVLNRSTSVLSDVAVEADLAAAHGELPMERQVAAPGTALEERHKTQRLAGGQSARFEGQVVLPLASARLIRQGRVALLVPLLRLRVRAAGIEPLAKTFAIGPGASGGGSKVVPFRLDEGPRSYEPLAQKAID